MKTLLVIASCIVSIITGLVLARGSGSVAKSEKARPLIGLSMDTAKEERWIQDRATFEARANELGADVLVQSANSDDSRQISDITALISRNVDVLVIIPHNGLAMAKAVNMAHEAGIPVIAYDRLIPGCDLDLYMTFDNVKVGELQANYLLEHLPPGKKKIVRIYGSKTDNNAFLFKEGQDKVLKPYIERGEVEVVHEDWAEDWRLENAKKITNAAITKVGAGGFGAVLASADCLSTGAIQALTEEGLAGKVLVTGQDAELSACQRLVRGTQTETVYKPLKKLAMGAAETAVKLAKHAPVIAKSELDNGKVSVPSIFFDIISVTKENLDATIVADGFHSHKEIYEQ